jgi:hypothetical protein
MKRIDRVWAKRYHGGYILWVPRLLEKLTNTPFIEFRGVTVATKDLRDAIKNGIRTEDCLFRVNGGLQIEEIQRYAKPNPDIPGTRVVAHRRSCRDYIHKIKSRKVKKHNGQLILALKPRIYG